MSLQTLPQLSGTIVNRLINVNWLGKGDYDFIAVHNAPSTPTHMETDRVSGLRSPSLCDQAVNSMEDFHLRPNYLSGNLADLAEDEANSQWLLQEQYSDDPAWKILQCNLCNEWIIPSEMRIHCLKLKPEVVSNSHQAVAFILKKKVRH